MSWMSIADFEERYRGDPDPWNYTTSDYERRKYEATLLACGPGPFANALELGSSIGVFSAMLAPRCRRLVTVDAAATAVASARRRLEGWPGVVAILGRIPEAIPEERFDLVVASEILYYLTPEVLEATLSVLEDRLLPGTSLVAVHWRPPGPERPYDAEAAHEVLRGRTPLISEQCRDTADYLLEVMRRR